MTRLFARIRHALNGDESELFRRRETLRFEILNMLRDIDNQSKLLNIEALQLTINNTIKQLQEQKP